MPVLDRQRCRWYEPDFDWGRYAIGWVLPDPHARSIAAEHSKLEVLHRHARAMLAQRPGDHHSYDENRHYRHPPSLITKAAPLAPFLMPTGAQTGAH